METDLRYYSDESVVQATLRDFCEKLGGLCNYVIDPTHHAVYIGSRYTEHYTIMEYMGLWPSEQDNQLYKKGIFKLDISSQRVDFVRYNNGQDYEDGCGLRHAVQEGFFLTMC